MQQRSYIQTAQFVDFPAEDLWTLISSIKGLEKWHPLINSCSVEGNIRICRTDKGDFQETILVNDSITRTFKYLIHPQKVYPLEDFIWCTFKVVDMKNGTLLMWDIEFLETSDQLFQQIKEDFTLLSNSVKSMIEALE